ncbi:MAG: ornithine carbamoyltransferase [bacterium]|nr:ornithine carbamoyltransferase [bacterium]
MLYNRDLLSINDLTVEDIENIFRFTDFLKTEEGKAHKPLIGKSVALYFEKPSTRTRVSFEVGIFQLGGQVIYLDSKSLQISRGETLADTARVLSRYVNCIVARTLKDETVRELAKYADIPVINALTNMEHPCQSLGDIYTVKEKLGTYKGIKFSYIGDGNNVANSLLLITSKLGINFSIASPVGYEIKEEIKDSAFKYAKESRAVIEFYNDPEVAVKDADIIYTDVWVSMGDEAEEEKRNRDFRSFKVDSRLLKLAKPTVKVMHCLPAIRGKEITDEVMDGPNSIIFDQAENRLHVQKAILSLILG